ncbi:MAG: carboxyl-terminal processing protease [Candidatus Azotimanducaceae bacterium]|jgi:carboxyl-terminal processing protease
MVARTISRYRDRSGYVIRLFLILFFENKEACAIIMSTMSDMHHETPHKQTAVRFGTNALLATGLAFVFAAAAFFSGLQIGSGMGSGSNLEANAFSLFDSQEEPIDDVSLDEFWRVWNLLEEKFVVGSTTDSLTDLDKVRGAIDGLVASYDDPYTVYLPPVDAQQFDEDISGNFSGVGMEVGIRDRVITIISPLPETPAQRAGLVAEDIIVRIDDAPTDGMSIDEAVRLIRGEKGTEVKLTIYREGELELMDIFVTRDNISIPTIKTEVKGDVFIIQLFSFNAISEMKMQEALREYTQSGATKIVLDLRGNPGGFLQSAVSIAGYFLPTGKIVVRESFGDGIDEQVFRSQGKNLKQFTPEEVVVLVNGGSASASEILAGALKEHKAAIVIGQTTFGKGSVQELVELPDGSSLKVTIARWLTPNGTSISEGGLEPDITIERTPQQMIDGEDPQLDAALEWLAGNKDIGQETEEDSAADIQEN